MTKVAIIDPAVGCMMMSLPVSEVAQVLSIVIKSLDSSATMIIADVKLLALCYVAQKLGGN